jgi:hypothetical protein
MKKTNWEKSRGMPFKHFPDVVYPYVFDIYVGVFFALRENTFGSRQYRKSHQISLIIHNTS